MRFWADQAGAFGGAILPGLTYAEHYGLWLNLGRVRWQRTSEVLQAIGLALSKGAMPDDYFDAVCPVAGDSVELARDVNFQREVASQKAQRGFRT